MEKSQYKHMPDTENKDANLDIAGLLKVLFKYRVLIIFISMLITIFAAYYALQLPTVHKVKVLMIPSNSSNLPAPSGAISGLASIAGIGLGGRASSKSARSLAKMETHKFLIDFVDDNNIKHILFADRWNNQDNVWIGEEPSDLEASDLLLDMISIEVNPKDQSGMVKFFLEWENAVYPNKVAEIANSIVSRINLNDKEQEIYNSKKSIKFLEKELDNTVVISTQNIIYSLIEKQMSNIMLANVTDEYIFQVIDPALPPEHPENKPILVIILLGLFVGLFLSFLIAISINYFTQNKIIN